MRLIHARSFTFALVLACVLAGIAPASQLTTQANGSDESKGRDIFRFDTFGDEQLWTTVLRMHDVIATVSPETALGVGLKVDVDALPRSIIAALRAGDVDLKDPAVTVGSSSSMRSSVSRTRERLGNVEQHRHHVRVVSFDSG
jgi:hypothetical protein